MAARTQLQMETQVETEAGQGCVHEHILAMTYERQRRRIYALSRWMAPDPATARQLALQVFVEACSRPRSTTAPAEGEADCLAAAFAAHFRNLFRAGTRPTASPGLMRDGEPAQPDARSAVRALPEAERLLYLLHDGEGYDPATLGAWLDLDSRRCAHWIHQARQRMCRSLRAAA